MKSLYVLLILCCMTGAASAQSGTKESFIPKEWKLIQETSGDLNKDSISDAALIIEYTGEAYEGLHPRALVILLKDKTGQRYIQACRADHRVILDAEFGGMMGEPFRSMTIRKNVLTLTFMGGNEETWTTTQQYRLKDNAYFEVIAATYTVEENGVTKSYDYNLLTGKIITTVKDASNSANNKTENRDLKLRPVNLESYEPDAVWAIMMPDFYDPVIVELPLTSASLDDCPHIVFDDIDYGKAELYLDEASLKLWRELSIGTEKGKVVANPKHKGKLFELTYIAKIGTKCKAEGEASYQLMIGFKLVP